MSIIHGQTVNKYIGAQYDDVLLVNFDHGGDYELRSVRYIAQECAQN